MVKGTSFAADIVLLPPENISEKIIALNKKARKLGQARGHLGTRDFYPHVSLAMGILRRSDLKKVGEIISEICHDFSPLSLTSSGLAFSLKNDGSKSYVLRFKKTKKLQELHEILLKELKPYFSYRGTVREVFKKKGERVKTPKYVNEFRKKNSFRNFQPHITLRVKKLLVEKFHLAFTARTLALCSVGTETTCRRIIFRAKI